MSSNVCCCCCLLSDGLVSYSVGGEPYRRLVGVDENVGAGVGETVGVGEGLLFDGRVGGAEEPPTPLLHQGMEGEMPQHKSGFCVICFVG